MILVNLHFCELSDNCRFYMTLLLKFVIECPRRIHFDSRPGQRKNALERVCVILR